MILIDSRVGSKELAPLFVAANQKHELVKLEYGDFAFEGNGPNGPVKVGIERKTWPDLLSSTNSNRFNGDQLIGLLENYSIAYLFIEGASRANPNSGMLEFSPMLPNFISGYGNGQAFHAIWSQITTFEHCGLKIREPINPYTSVQEIINLYQWFSRPWESHNSHQRVKDIRFSVKRASTVAKVARALGLGHEGARRAEQFFGSVKAMVNAAPEDWVIKGVVSSAQMAQKMWRACNR